MLSSNIPNGIRVVKQQIDLLRNRNDKMGTVEYMNIFISNIFHEMAESNFYKIPPRAEQILVESFYTLFTDKFGTKNDDNGLEDYLLDVTRTLFVDFKPTFDFIDRKDLTISNVELRRNQIVFITHERRKYE